MAHPRRWTAVLCALVGATAVIAGCSSPASAPEPSITPPPPQPVVANDLTDEEISAIVSEQCGPVFAARGGDPVAEVRALDQFRADAVVFLASSAQCDDIPTVLDGESGDPAVPFVSPVQVLDPPCPGDTLVSFWAHYDDDLIFGNPELDRALQAGDCVRTFFFTYSDAGEGESTYASEREAGIRAAYDVMRGSSGPWTDRTIQLASGAVLTMSRPVDDDRITLFFLRLPDGGLAGATFEYTGEQTLTKLNSGELLSLRTLDTGRSVSRATLEKTVRELIEGYDAATVLTHQPTPSDSGTPDHPDHRAVGEIVSAAVAQDLADRVRYALGYPSDAQPVNVGDAELARKLAAFSAYASHDPVLKCSDPTSCLRRVHFGDWLQRQYLTPAVPTP
ncbi:hypothetical protein F6J84_00080 [Microbacterium caowuchunii]|uniref:PIG-L deacetylase family protein n=1 Tax=Microbacterium caowuchunii TaxID=2614638 RepID=UPI001249082C|nr:PIG-L family deacetylase [Microbacterium caowuchunii]QEV98673.1 hypothetical protein F6J84_00080 [Microbacterium caowuchunii]